jgi:hypothetical protein
MLEILVPFFRVLPIVSKSSELQPPNDDEVRSLLVEVNDSNFPYCRWPGLGPGSAK